MLKTGFTFTSNIMRIKMRWALFRRISWRDEEDNCYSQDNIVCECVRKCARHHAHIFLNDNRTSISRRETSSSSVFLISKPASISLYLSASWIRTRGTTACCMCVRVLVYEMWLWTTLSIHTAWQWWQTTMTYLSL